MHLQKMDFAANHVRHVDTSWYVGTSSYPLSRPSWQKHVIETNTMARHLPVN